MTGRALRIRLHAALRDDAGLEAIDVLVPVGATPRDAVDAAIAHAPTLQRYREVVAFGTDERLLATNDSIPAGVTVIHALPPVSGG